MRALLILALLARPVAAGEALSQLNAMAQAPAGGEGFDGRRAASSEKSPEAKLGSPEAAAGGRRGALIGFAVGAAAGIVLGWGLGLPALAVAAIAVGAGIGPAFIGCDAGKHCAIDEECG